MFNINDLKKVNVEQLANKNQFLITYKNDDHEILCFQSYKSLVACWDFADKILYVSWRYWDYSKTTLKHFKMFVNEYTDIEYKNKQDFINKIKTDQQKIVLF